MPNKIVVKSEMSINAPVERVWNFLTQPERFARLFSHSASADFAPQKNSLIGTMILGELTFQLNLTPYDLLLSAPACTIVMRLSEQPGDRCHAVMAASCQPESGFVVRERDLFNVLSRLRSVTGYPEEATDADAPQAQPEAGKSRKVYHSGDGKAQTADTAGAADTHSNRNRKRIVTAVALLAIVAAAIFGLSRLAARPAAPSTSQSSARDLSALVNLDNAKGLQLGASRRDVEALFGTDGVKLGGDRWVYRSDALSASGQPLEQVCVTYTGNTVSALTYLNLTNSTTVGAVTNLFPGVSATDLDGIVDQVGAPLSMYRLHTAGEQTQLEAHFGYIDPFANFDPAWRGEIAVTVLPDTGEIRTDCCRGYDGSDPLLVASLEKSHLSNQFDSYTVYLQDKYQYDKAMLLTGKFSRGDADKIFGPLSEYDAGSGAMAWRAVSAETLADGTTPLYQYSFGFEGTGTFNMAAYVNMRLLNKSGMLEGTRWQAVTRNMSYGEVRTLAGILPTAVYVNGSQLLVCYGCYIEGFETEQQFEMVVKFNLETMYVENVYFNENKTGA